MKNKSLKWPKKPNPNGDQFVERLAKTNRGSKIAMVKIPRASQGAIRHDVQIPTKQKTTILSQKRGTNKTPKRK